MLSKLVFLSLSALVLSDPGAPWTEEEALIVKAKLYAVIGLGPNRVIQDYLALHSELGLTSWPEKKTNPSAAKFLR